MEILVYENSQIKFAHYGINCKSMHMKYPKKQKKLGPDSKPDSHLQWGIGIFLWHHLVWPRYICIALTTHWVTVMQGYCQCGCIEPSMLITKHNNNILPNIYQKILQNQLGLSISQVISIL